MFRTDVRREQTRSDAQPRHLPIGKKIAFDRRAIVLDHRVETRADQQHEVKHESGDVEAG